MLTTTKPVYVLHGADAFLRDIHRDEIVTRAVGDADPQVCRVDFDGMAELADVLDELRTIPFLAPRRVVIVRDADAFVSAYRKNLESYVESPSTSSVLILMVLSWRANWKLAKLVNRVGQAIDCSAPDERALPRWLAQAAAQRGKKIAPDAARLLTELVGGDLAALDGEVEKLATFVGETETIAVEDVSSLVAATAGPGAFALTDALVAGDAAAALKALDGLLIRRGDELATLGRIAAHLRRGLRAQHLAAAGGRPEEALHPRTPYRAKNAFLAMLRRRGLRTLQADFRRLIRTDLTMKSGGNAKAAMQELVVGLCS